MELIWCTWLLCNQLRISGDAPGVQTSITELDFTLHLCQCSKILLLESTLSFYTCKSTKATYGVGWDTWYSNCKLSKLQNPCGGVVMTNKQYTFTSVWSWIALSFQTFRCNLFSRPCWLLYWFLWLCWHLWHLETAFSKAPGFTDRFQCCVNIIRSTWFSIGEGWVKPFAFCYSKGQTPGVDKDPGALI